MAPATAATSAAVGVAGTRAAARDGVPSAHGRRAAGATGLVASVDRQGDGEDDDRGTGAVLPAVAAAPVPGHPVVPVPAVVRPDGRRATTDGVPASADAGAKAVARPLGQAEVGDALPGADVVLGAGL